MSTLNQLAEEKRKISAYERIVIAAKMGMGCRLSADDCFQLAKDHAIYAAAENAKAEREDTERGAKE